MAIDFNTTTILASPVVSGVEWIVGALKLIMGGMFGLYIIMIFVRLKEFREIRKLNKQTREMYASLSKMHNEIKAMYTEMKKKK